MKATKILILMLVCSLLLTTVGQVSAADEEKTVTDLENDVITINSEGEEVMVSDHPNIDITQLTYSKTDDIVTMTLTVKNKIENRGNLTSEIGIMNSVVYTLMLITNKVEYEIIYINNVANISYDFTSSEDIPEENFSVEDDTLTITFALLNEDEVYDSMTAQTVEISLENLNPENFEGFYQDTASDLPVQVLIFTEIDEEYTGETVEFTSYTDYGSPPYEWLWDFGDGETSNEQNPTHEYTEKGEYTVTITVTDSQGETSSDSLDLNIKAKPSDNGDTSSESPITVFIIIIAIIAIIGVVAVVIIVRR